VSVVDAPKQIGAEITIQIIDLSRALDVNVDRRPLIWVQASHPTQGGHDPHLQYRTRKVLDLRPRVD
jgi:hypothetical protein